MIDMEVSMEGNGPCQVHQQVSSSPGSDVNAIQINESNKMTPQGLCRRLVSAHQEMEVFAEILTSAKKSHFQNDYLELNANLSKKKEYLLKWVSRFGICPIAECKIHHADLKSNQSKTTTKRAASEISSHNDQANSSKDFKKPNRKHTAKANFISACFSTGNGPLKDHLQVPSSSAAAEAMLTEPPLLSDADHCTAITAARAQLKDKEKAVDLIQQILQNQNILIDGGVIQRTALKPTMDGLKTAEAALAEATKRPRVRSPNYQKLCTPSNHSLRMWRTSAQSKCYDGPLLGRSSFLIKDDSSAR
ncbi:hypothetical protein CDAR_89761 [Caerostris darwini]|uniref:Uncharacterized protein n=1 Tax=Caerostris darwini TaxID=1538125 RepID=A0AAV4UYM9_9ARAC|nr:hypothetical protein CDAR_89761 [Caerostris darwini]